MSEITIPVTMSFQQILKIVEMLSEQERIVLLKKLGQKTPVSWQAKFGRELKKLGEKNKRIPLEEVMLDVEEAIREVRVKNGK